VVTALYRRYRPETFAEMIGQSQVTEPLMTALRTNRVNHAYLFSGPRGCGKTTSARILARCLNCAEGPTDTPCGTCDSCVELGRGGQGSLDVVEIDAASHNGVDDARDIRERAIFAPARDRYKIFILDEAHMVTPQGFNALLKIVEEPPEHVKFIFATTEPDKVIGTIRSRTHHYPFRLVPPAQMLDYVQQLCESEGMSVAPGVLPLVVRAGGGSPRDTLSLLDQLIAGSEGATIEYERAVALLGYTHAALLDEVVDAIGAVDAPTAFAAVDRVIQTGQDPRRFVEDLLERLRDLIIVAATSPDAAAAVLRGTPQEELDRMSVQASVFGAAELSRCADIVNSALTEMTGATSPRLHLELMIARMLVPASDATDRGALARVERLERRVGVQSTSGDSDSGLRQPAPARKTAERPAGAGVSRTSAVQSAGDEANPSDGAAPGAAATAATSAWSVSAPSGPAAEPPSNGASSNPVPPAPQSAAAAPSAPASATASPSVNSPSAPTSLDPAVAQAAAFAAAAAAKKGAASGGAQGAAAAAEKSAASAWATPGVTDDAQPPVIGAVTTQQVRDAWPEILESVAESSRSAWAVVYTATVRALDGDVLSLSFPSANDVESFRGKPGAQDAASEVLRQSIIDLLGIRVKFVAKPAGLDGGQGGSAPGGDGGPGPGGPGSEIPKSDPPGGTTGVPGPAGAGQAGAGPAGSGPAGRRQAEAAPTSPAAPGQRPSDGSTAQRAPAPAGSTSGSHLSATSSPTQPSAAQSAKGRPAEDRAQRQSTPSGPSQASSAGSHTSTTVGWATVTIPGSSATALLDRPGAGEQSEPAVSDRTESPSDATHLGAGEKYSAAEPVGMASSRPSGPATDAGSSRPPVEAAVGGIAERSIAFSEEEPPDDDEPPFPDEYPGDPRLSSIQNAQPMPSAAQGAQTAQAAQASASAAASSSAPAGFAGKGERAQPNATGPSVDPSGAQPVSRAAAGHNPNRRDASSGPAGAKASVGFREPARYGEAVVRELLGAKFLEEQQIAPAQGGQGSGQGGQPGWAR
jgi:DNA polymerase-3 subunit gamma/tau